MTRDRFVPIIFRMIVVQADRISRHYTEAPVFEDVSFQIEAGQRIGLVGPNGAGKSTLVRVLLGRDPPDTGAIAVHPDAKVAMLAQFADFPEGQTLLAETRSALAHLEGWYDEMVAAGRRMADPALPEDERNRFAKRYDHLQEQLRRHGGYDFDHRVEEILFGLGFKPVDFERKLSTFSGGQQSRVLLAKLLLSSPDLMLLDEPTNHLDIATTEWLEDYLTRQAAGMVIVSHDRYFLDRTVTHVFEMFQGRLTEYTGNYRTYSAQRAERQKVNERVLDKQQKAIAHYEEFVKKNKAGQLSKQAKSREKMIARLQDDLVDQIADVSGPAMGFGEATRTGDVVLAARDLTKRFGEKTLFENVQFEIERGQRVGVIGPNGAGKTTLLRMLLGEEPATAGTVRQGQNFKVGYLEQDLRSLDLDAAPLEVVRPEWRAAEKLEVFRGLLARFGIGADLVEQRLGTLSGGERTRVALARLAAREVNVLALDEPTNHLDLWACESLEKALEAFNGTVVIVSHDRYFLNQTVDRLLIVEDGDVRLLAGDYDHYLDWKKQQAAAERKKPPAAVKTESKKKRKFPFRKTSDLEADIARCESQIAEAEELQLKPEVYKDGRRAAEIDATLTDRRKELERLLEHWEESMELNS
ncbi:MAG: ABC-F family ATP-binding cassette domain-containing protein [Planctomycetia bacterium]